MTFNAGDEVDAVDMAAAIPSICHCVQQTAQTGWTTGTPTAITFGTGSTVIDTDAIHSESSNTSRFVIGKRLGWWEVSGVYCPPSNSATTLVRVILYKNGSPVLGSFAGLPFASTTALIGVAGPVIQIEAQASTDYVEVYGHQAAASGTVGTSITSPYVNCSARLRWVRSS